MFLYTIYILIIYIFMLRRAFVGILLLCVCRGFMMFANLVDTFVPIVGLLFKFLGRIKNISNRNMKQQEKNSQIGEAGEEKKLEKTHDARCFICPY